METGLRFLWKKRRKKCEQKTLKSIKNTTFCSEREKMHKENKESIVNIALVSDALISYNVVTKVTTRCF